MKLVGRFLAALPILLLAPVLVTICGAALFSVDLFWRLFGRRRPLEGTASGATCASVVIPNWNGRDLLEKYLPSVVTAMAGDPRNEIIVVDNGSQDGSADLIRSRFPEVRVLALPQNLGFGGGSNEGFRAAKNDIVVLLNSDMRVDPDFLAPLLAGFTDSSVFSVSCQIFFSDPARVREETGLTQGWWEAGRLRVRHRDDDRVNELYPCFYGGGGSCAYDRRKFLELGCFDHLLAPFYLEDTDLGYMAWKRGWKSLYQPASVVFHEHRGTIGKTFSRSAIDGILRKNFILFTWKNIHEGRKFLSHLWYLWSDCAVSVIFGSSLERANLTGVLRAFRQLPQAMKSRWRARNLAQIDDTEAFRRPLGGYFRDRFAGISSSDKLSVLFVSPYPICPPIHGGGVFMYQTTRILAELVDLHLIVLLDKPSERAPHEELIRKSKSAEFLVRMTGTIHTFGSIAPHAIDEFRNSDLEWLIHRQIYTQRVDVVQLEYLPMGQYARDFQRIVSILFEHDVYFQSIARQLPGMKGLSKRLKAQLEYLRALRYELDALRHFDRVQVCSAANRDYVASFRPEFLPRLDDELRAGIDTSLYDFRTDGREPFTLLFLGSFRHLPNREALDWFTRYVLPPVRAVEPRVRLVVVGSDPPPEHSIAGGSAGVELRGFVADVHEPLERYSVFVCPVLSGSGMRVKLLEAFASGIPVVSTRIGAEGLGTVDGEFCALADDPQTFARRILDLLADPDQANAMARRARALAVERRDMRAMTLRLVDSYRNALAAKRQPTSASHRVEVGG